MENWDVAAKCELSRVYGLFHTFDLLIKKNLITIPGTSWILQKSSYKLTPTESNCFHLKLSHNIYFSLKKKQNMQIKYL